MFLENVKIFNEREIRLFGVPIMQYGSRYLINEQQNEKYLHKSLAHRFLDYILSFVPSNWTSAILSVTPTPGRLPLCSIYESSTQRYSKLKDSVCSEFFGQHSAFTAMPFDR